MLTAGAGAAAAQPAPMNSAFVSNNGAATKSSMLNMSANTIEPAAAAVVPVFNSSFGFRSVGTGNKPGTAPVNPAKSPSPSITAGDNATLTSFSSDSSASAKATFAE